MKHKICWEYTGYLTNRIVAIDEAIAGIDLTETCDQLSSLGWDEPIITLHNCKKYHVEETQDLPWWVDLERFYSSTIYSARVMMCGDIDTNLNRLIDTPISDRDFENIVKLLKTKKFKSEFRQSLRDQVLLWLNNPNAIYNSPLSYRQLAAIDYRR